MIKFQQCILSSHLSIHHLPRHPSTPRYLSLISIIRSVAKFIQVIYIVVNQLFGSPTLPFPFYFYFILLCLLRIRFVALPIPFHVNFFYLQFITHSITFLPYMVSSYFITYITQLSKSIVNLYI